MELTTNHVHIDTIKREVIKDGVAYPFGTAIKGHSVTIIDGEAVFIDGYELLKSGAWKMTLKALRHCN